MVTQCERPIDADLLVSCLYQNLALIVFYNIIVRFISLSYFVYYDIYISNHRVSRLYEATAINLMFCFTSTPTQDIATLIYKCKFIGVVQQCTMLCALCFHIFFSTLVVCGI